jgi:hypothetical protein
MENILINDNFLSSNDIEICKKILSDNKWEFGHTSTNNIITTPFWYMDLFNNHFLKDVITHKIEKIYNKKFKINRLYANGQTYGQDGNFHQDDTSKTAYTFCLYFTEYPKEFCDLIEGNIQFKIPDQNNFIISVSPLFNRGILFPSYYYHRGLSFNRYIPDLRICIAWKFIEI